MTTEYTAASISYHLQDTGECWVWSPTGHRWVLSMITYRAQVS